VGRALYREHCSSCHAEDGSGDKRRMRLTPGVDLTRSPMVRARLDGRIYQAIRYGLEAMPGFSHQLEHREIQALTRFVLGLGQTQAPAESNGELPAKSGGMS
jgi:mono/diheme cytochrome c family protein